MNNQLKGCQNMKDRKQSIKLHTQSITEPQEM